MTSEFAEQWEINLPQDVFNAVNKPKHYTQGNIECIDAIKSAIVGLEGAKAFYAGQVIKYVFRHAHKGNDLQDLQKSKFYLDGLIEMYKNGDVK